jgi:menaquinone-9 beta-reductase
VTEHAPPETRPGNGLALRPPADEADVIVVGAGPAGATTAFYLAQAGLDVLLLEKARFPREKVCGDGLTPRAVKALVGMGINVSDGWVRNKGLRVIGAGKRLELPWPELASYPGYGLVRTRHDLDEALARRAQQAGARLLEGVTVTGPVVDERTGRITGVRGVQGDGESPRARGARGERGDGESPRERGGVWGGRPPRDNTGR